ncbi:multi-sensor signal transduction histidine kinase [Naegleria gruberi]|uniref:histidine kinase n=1 Tax=Naegleria gruberi TaxID=5762 RepID=D2VDJ6_NAEGR|nr:multi-sensor signal transduction histidine kinase [Naegleria gruberi]EFC45246.1 multi-sensor signal transduction histidine kinase [Naegleria gruberi]|eukprot:XP_002677990.1 multi-sensor signal transduction histidine kinase [Naegleria gruberi strain NEG-M]
MNSTDTNKVAATLSATLKHQDASACTTTSTKVNDLFQSESAQDFVKQHTKVSEICGADKQLPLNTNWQTQMGKINMFGQSINDSASHILEEDCNFKKNTSAAEKKVSEQQHPNNYNNNNNLLTTSYSSSVAVPSSLLSTTIYSCGKIPSSDTTDISNTKTTSSSPSTTSDDTMVPPQQHMHEEARALANYRMKLSKNFQVNNSITNDDEFFSNMNSIDTSHLEEEEIPTKREGTSLSSSQSSSSFIQASFSPSLLSRMQSSPSGILKRRHSHHLTENPLLPTTQNDNNNMKYNNKKMSLDNIIDANLCMRKSKSMANNCSSLDNDHDENNLASGLENVYSNSSSNNNIYNYHQQEQEQHMNRSFSNVSSDGESDILPAILSRRLSQCLPSIFTNWKQVIDLQTKFMIMFVFLDYLSLVLTTYFRQGLFNSLIMLMLCMLGFVSVKWSFLRDLPSYVNDLYKDSKTYSRVSSLNNNEMEKKAKKKPTHDDELASSWSHKLTSYAVHYSTSQLVFFNLLLFTLRFLMSDSKMLLTPMSLFSIASIAACKYRDSILHSKKHNNPSRHLELNGTDDIETVIWAQFPFYYIAFHYFCYMLYQLISLLNDKSDMSIETAVMIVIENYPSISMVMIFGFFAVFASIYISVEYRKLTNIATKLKEAVQIKNNFLSHVSHELRTPLLSSLGSIELMKETPLTSEQYDHLEIIHASNSILLTLIEDILVFIDLDHKKPKAAPTMHTTTQNETENISYNTIVNTDKAISPRVIQSRDNIVSFSLSRSLRTVLCLLEKYANKFKVTIEFEIEEILETLVVKTNETRLQQCIINLLTNAIKASIPDTSVHLKCSVNQTQESDDTKIWLDISVTDYGIGIPYEKQQSIFEPFQQLHNLNESVSPGTGLGLCTTKRYVENNFKLLILEKNY